MARHRVHVSKVDTQSPLTVGNGEFAFTADVTGLQTLNTTYVMPPLQTMSHWAWHTIPAALAGVEPSDFKEQAVTVNGHTSHYPTQDGQPQSLVDYLRSNPHRFNLGRVFLRRGVSAGAAAIAVADLTQINQTLDLWTGTLRSHFDLDGTAVAVETVVHPTLDQVAVRVCSPLLAQDDALAIGLAFPYGDTAFKGGSDWHVDASRHTSERVSPPSECDPAPVLRHTLDGTSYFMRLSLNSSAASAASASAAGASAAGASAAGACVRLLAVDGEPHAWSVSLKPSNTAASSVSSASASSGSSCLEVGAWFTLEEQPSPLPSVRDAMAASAAHWPAAWQEGAALDLSGSTAAGAQDLERRVVLSQFIMMSQVGVFGQHGRMLLLLMMMMSSLMMMMSSLMMMMSSLMIAGVLRSSKD